jgi:hypothetical protein
VRYQLRAIEAADLGEDVIAVSDLAFEVGRGDQALLVGEGVFALGYGLIVTHRGGTSGR